jgi:hypothetical protein
MAGEQESTRRGQSFGHPEQSENWVPCSSSEAHRTSFVPTHTHTHTHTHRQDAPTPPGGLQRRARGSLKKPRERLFLEGLAFSQSSRVDAHRSLASKQDPMALCQDFSTVPNRNSVPTKLSLTSTSPSVWHPRFCCR